MLETVRAEIAKHVPPGDVTGRSSNEIGALFMG
jgi:hypothetical protein